MNMEINMNNKLYSLDFAYITEILNWHNNSNEDLIYVVWNTDNELIFVSDYLSEFHNFDNVSNVKWFDFVPSTIYQNVINHFSSSQEDLFIPHIALKNLEGIEFEFDALIAQITIKNEPYFMCKLRNQTEINNLKSLLLEAQKLKIAGEYSAGIVHEFRNPLTSLKGFLQLVQSGRLQKREYYKVMIDEVEKLENLTYELLSLAKPAQEEFTSGFMDEMIQDVLLLINSQSQMSKIFIKHNLERNLELLCNPSQIKQVLLNLIQNGAEAMALNGELNINCYEKDQEVVVEVIDTGEGIPAESIENLTSAFYTTKKEGTGLGLMISAHILDKHSGRFEINSEEGIGTTFKVIIPLIK